MARKTTQHNSTNCITVSLHLFIFVLGRPPHPFAVYIVHTSKNVCARTCTFQPQKHAPHTTIIITVFCFSSPERIDDRP